MSSLINSLLTVFWNNEVVPNSVRFQWWLYVSQRRFCSPIFARYLQELAKLALYKLGRLARMSSRAKPFSFRSWKLDIIVLKLTTLRNVYIIFRYFCLWRKITSYSFPKMKLLKNSIISLFSSLIHLFKLKPDWRGKVQSLVPVFGLVPAAVLFR